MRPKRQTAARETRLRGRRLSLLAGLLTVLLALAAGADSNAPQANQKAAAATTQQAPQAVPARSPEASSHERGAGSGRSNPSNVRNGPPLPTRRSLRAQIESIDPGVWLSRYGLVERRELR